MNDERMLIRGFEQRKWVLNGNISIMSIQYWNQYHWLILTRSARMEGTSMNEIKSIKQYSILISIELPGMNRKVDWHFED